MDLSELLMARAYTGGGSGGSTAKMYVIEVASQSGDEVTAHIVDTDTGHYLTPSDLFVEEDSPRLKNMFNLMMTQSNTCMYFSVLMSGLDGEEYCIIAMNDQMGVMSFASSEGWDSDVWLVEFNPTNDGEPLA